MQQLPPFPDNDPGEAPQPGQAPGQPSSPGRPTEAPAEHPAQSPDIDVPAPVTPGTQPPTTPISPVG